MNQKITNKALAEGKTKEKFFIILYKREQKEKPKEFIFSKSDIIPNNIYINELKEENESYFYKKVFKLSTEISNDNSKKNPVNYNFEFKIGDDKYIVSFEVNTNCFIYDIKLQKKIKNDNNFENKI